MLSSEQERQIQRLLMEGKLSQTQIAQHVGVSRSTVAAISCGSRSTRKVSPCEPSEPFPVQEPAPEDEMPPPVRCPSCGGLVYLPCRLCRLRSLLERQKQRRQWRQRIKQARRRPRRQPP